MSDFTKFIKQFSKIKVTVIGDFMIDEYLHGTVDRISPEAPVPVVWQRRTNTLLGGAGNVVRNLLSLGCRVSTLGIIGQDEDGIFLEKKLISEGVKENLFFKAKDVPTIKKTRVFAGNQQVCRIDREEKLISLDDSEKFFLTAIEKAMDGCGAVILSDYDKGVITPNLIRKVVEIANKTKSFVAVDPQVTHFSAYQGVGVLTPNHHEAGRFLGRTLFTDESVEKAGKEIRTALKSEMVLITRGDKGMSLIDDAGCKHIPTVAQEVFDVTGAGDTVTSVFALAIASGASGAEAAKLSNAAAGIVVGHLGAATITSEELENAIS